MKNSIHMPATAWAIVALMAVTLAGIADRVRFERDVQSLGVLQHPSFVTIHDSGAAVDGSHSAAING